MLFKNYSQKFLRTPVVGFVDVFEDIELVAGTLALACPHEALLPRRVNLVGLLLFFVNPEKVAHLILHFNFVPDVPSALSDHVQVFARVQDFIFVLEQKVRSHLLAEGEALEPIQVVEVLADLLFLKLGVFFDYEFFKVVLENALEDPFLHCGDVRH